MKKYPVLKELCFREQLNLSKTATQTDDQKLFRLMQAKSIAECANV